MSDRMSAAEYRKLVGADESEPENPYQMHFTSAVKEGEKMLDILSGKNKDLQVTKPQPTEHQIQSSILDRLGLLSGAFFWRENSGLLRVGQPGSERFFRAGIAGIPDIMGVYKGRSVGIEVKRPGKKQSADQKAFERRFDECGGIYVLCTDATQVISQIELALSMDK